MNGYLWGWEAEGAGEGAGRLLGLQNVLRAALRGGGCAGMETGIALGSVSLPAANGPKDGHALISGTCERT